MSRLGVDSNRGRAGLAASAGSRMAAVLLLAAGGLLAMPAGAAVCRVKTTGLAASDGSDWAQATSLQAALGRAACTELWVAAGAYKPANGSDRDASFVIRAGIAVYGGFGGAETDRAQRDPAQHRSVLSGDIDGNDIVDAHGVTRDHGDIVGNNSYTVVRIAPTALIDTVLDGFTLSAGQANRSMEPDAAFTARPAAAIPLGIAGGGLSCQAEAAGERCGPTLRALVIRGNRSDSLGGGLFCSGNSQGRCEAILRDVAFVGNSAGNGGAMALFSADGGGVDAVVENATFSRNVGIDGNAGLFAIGGSGVTRARLRNATFSGNEGGAILGMPNGPVENLDVQVSDSVLWDDVGNPSAYGTGVPVAFQRSLFRLPICPSPSTFTQTISGDPQLGALQEDGRTPLFVPGAGSVVVDAVDCTGVPTQDQRGVARPQGLRCDIGATEVRHARVTVAVSGGGKANAIADPAPVGAGVVNCREDSGVCTASYRVDPPVPGLLLTLQADAGQAVQSASGCGGSLAAGGFTFSTAAIDTDCSVSVQFAPLQRHIGGTVTGLAGSGLQLSLNGSETLAVSADGAFRFNTTLAGGDAYAAAIAVQPQQPRQDCVVVNGSGVVGAGDVTNIVIHCGAAATYTVGGTLSGLASGASVDLSVNGGPTLTLAANGAYAFAPRFLTGDSYRAEITAQPDAQYCTLARVEGTIGATDVTDLDVSCTAGGAQLQLSVDDGGTFARYGQMRDYRITLANHGNGTATDVAVDALLDASFDQANLRWICVAGTPGATCAASGSGAFHDIVTLSPGTRLVWVVSVPIHNDSPDAQAVFLAQAAGAPGASDTNTLVLFRDGLDVPYGDGATAPGPSAAAAATKGIGAALEMPHADGVAADPAATAGTDANRHERSPVGLGASTPRAAVAPGDPTAVPVDDPASLFGLILLLMVGGGAIASRWNGSQTR